MREVYSAKVRSGISAVKTQRAEITPSSAVRCHPRGEQRYDELPHRWCAPRPSHDPRVGCYAHKLVEDPPGGVPGIWSYPLALELVAAGAMKLRICIGG